VLKTSCVYTRSFRPDENKLVDDPVELSRLTCPVEKDTIIISRMNTPELVGASRYVPRDYSDLFLPDRLWMARFSPRFRSYAKVFAEVISTPRVRALLAAIATGTSGSMKNISQEDILGIRVPVPPADEIRALETAIDEGGAQLQRPAQRARQAIYLLEEHGAALIAAAVTGKIDVRDTAAASEAVDEQLEAVS
jgi:type I restriction enzyme S subunit